MADCERDGRCCCCCCCLSTHVAIRSWSRFSREVDLVERCCLVVVVGRCGGAHTVGRPAARRAVADGPSEVVEGVMTMNSPPLRWIVIVEPVA